VRGSAAKTLGRQTGYAPRVVRRVAIVQPPVSVSRDFIDYPYFADLGAVSMAAALRREGHSVSLVDAYAMEGSRVHERGGRFVLGAEVDEVVAAIPDDVELVIVGYTPFHRPPRRDELLGALLGRLRGAGVSLVLADLYQSGQHYVEAAGSAVLAAYPEVIGYVKYEAEATLADLVRSGQWHGVHEGRQVPLDELPLAAWDLVDLEAHDRFRTAVIETFGRKTESFPIDGRTLPLVTSRGCPFTCVHCSSNPDQKPGEPKTQRRFSIERLREHVTALVRIHGASRLFVLDELVNVNERHFDAFLALAGELDVRFEVPNGMRADYLLPRHFARMRGRVTTVSVSAESGSDRVVRDVVKKRLDLRAIERAAENADRAGVPLLVHYMIGLPGETRAEINQTLEYALDLFDRFRAMPALQYATPLPGTELARGRSLPVVDDWGPLFQRVPTASDVVSADELAQFRRTFEKRLRAASSPQKVIVNATYVCNNHCTFCAVGTRTQVDARPTRVLEHLVKYARAGVELVDFDGGEPTLHPDIIGLVRNAKSLGYTKIHITTNGRLMSYPDFAKRLVTSGVTSVLFSVHGPDMKSHAREVGVAEAFDQTVAGIRNAVACAPETVELGMNVTLTRTNTEKLPAIARLCFDLGLRWLNVQFLTPFGRATKAVAPDTARAAEVTMRVIDEWNERMKLQVINLPFCFMPGYERYLAGDLGKHSRHMVFVNNETVNLAAYLAERRVRKPVCDPCVHRAHCGGFYELDEVPEPPWLVSEESLLARVRPD
jgi:MoaA/NifB/PqqE/SkfB family radical SAM enzyme